MYLRSSGLSFSVKKVMAFPWCPALPVRPEKQQTRWYPRELMSRQGVKEEKYMQGDKTDCTYYMYYWLIYF